MPYEYGAGIVVIVVLAYILVVRRGRGEKEVT
jgi:hypothetical protein